jgi:hypothetical protein
MRAMLLLLLLTGTAAAAPELTVEPRAAGTGTDADAMAHARSADDGCSAGCASVVLKSAELRDGVHVEIRETAEDLLDAPRLGIAVRRGDTWYAAPDEIALLPYDCGAGHCTQISLDAVTIRQTDDIVWVTFEVSRTVTFMDEQNGRMNYTTQSTHTEGCKLETGGVRCGYVVTDAGSKRPFHIAF